jgi:phospholipid/cholesterol/gamma-HCH transport system permease protein
MTRFLNTTGRFVLSSVEESGYTLDLFVRSLYWLRDLRKRRRFIVDQLFVCGIRPLPVIVVVAVFTGMILALQTGLELARFGQKERIADILGVVLCREMGPFMTALILTASVGASMAAEIGTMKVSEEIDALEVMTINPATFLVMPRVVALGIMCPMLTLFTNAIGVIGGSLVGAAQLDIAPELFFRNVLDSLSNTTTFFNLPKDLYTGLFKAHVFGLIIATIGCASGLRASGGALGVGRCTRSAVINSFLIVIISGYYMTWIFYR